MVGENMTAREMFEKLGYEERKHENYIRYVGKFFVSDWYNILFDLERKTIYPNITSDSPFTPAEPLEISVDLLQAINKQAEELGWK